MIEKKKNTDPCRAGNPKSKTQSDATQEGTDQGGRTSGRETPEPATA